MTWPWRIGGGEIGLYQANNCLAQKPPVFISPTRQVISQLKRFFLSYNRRRICFLEAMELATIGIWWWVGKFVIHSLDVTLFIAIFGWKDRQGVGCTTVAIWRCIRVFILNLSRLGMYALIYESCVLGRNAAQRRRLSSKPSDMLFIC